jgi:hypothetical protein
MLLPIERRAIAGERETTLAPRTGTPASISDADIVTCLAPGHVAFDETIRDDFSLRTSGKEYSG